jgi:hypothetical protein
MEFLMGLLDQQSYAGYADEGQRLAVEPMSFTPMDAAKFIAEATPIIGDAMAAKEIYDELQRPEPDLGYVAVLGGAALLGLIPLIGDAASPAIKKVGKGLLDMADRIEVDPSMMGMSFGNIKLNPKADPTQTGWTFKDVEKPTLNKEENRRVSALTSRVEEVPINQIYATQPTVNPDFSTTSSSAGELPFVVRKNGKMFVQDGHHRLTKVAEEGVQNAKVRFIDLDGADTSTPLLDYDPNFNSEIKGILDTLSNPSPPKPKNTIDDVPLIAQHNLNIEGLRTTEDIGGIPMPSIAISNANKPLENFGDISLVMRPDQISPNRNMSVWPADAYTGRQPRHLLEYVDEDAALKNITSDPNFSHMSKNILGGFSSLSDADDALKAAQYAIANPSIKVNPKDFSNLHELSREVSRKIGSWGELDEYAGLSAYGDMVRKLKPEDPFTPSGNRRKTVNYDMPTLMKRMKKAKAYNAGTEKGFTGGGGLMRALSTNKFKNLQEIKNSRGLLANTDANDMQDIKDQFESVVYGNVSDFSKKYFGGSFNKTQDYLESIAQGQSTAWADAPAGAMSDAVRILNSFKSEVKDMPTEYFEAKPKTALSLSEFPTAVVPKQNIEAQDILRRQGVSDIQLYDDAVEGMTRADIFKKLNEYKFAIPIGGLLGYNVLNNDEQTLKNNMGLL